MQHSQHSSIVSFIWGIADDVLRDNYRRVEYRDVILAMTVVRRFDAILEPTKQAVLDMKERLDAAGIVEQGAGLCQASGQAFYNASGFTLRDLASRPRQQQLRTDVEAYLDGFSRNVTDIIRNFGLRNEVEKLSDKDILGALIGKFVDPVINLSPSPVVDPDGTVRTAGLDNHGMGTVFEELMRRFNDEDNEEAGEHFTPRDVVDLMAQLVFLPVADQIESGTYLVYDGACGTGGMLTVAEETLQRLAQERGTDVSIHLYGQEVNDKTYAICKADILLKGAGEAADNIKDDSTLSADGFPAHEFDFMLSNPPYGKSWKTDLDRMGGKTGMRDPRFVVHHADEPECSLITRSSDGQLLFLANKLSKMKRTTALGSRIAHVHNGSSLFTGDAGQGESNIRRWIIENDWLEAIVALPENLFYNTGIATYIWVLTNRKPTHRQGKVQLIDATARSHPLRRNLGQKNCALAEEHIEAICDAFAAFEESRESRILANKALGYQKVVVERPLRVAVDLSREARREFRVSCDGEEEARLADVADNLATTLGLGSHLDWNVFAHAARASLRARGTKPTVARLKRIREGLGHRDQRAAPVVRTSGPPSPNADADVDALYGRFHIGQDMGHSVVQYEPDTELRDTEQVPLSEEGGVEAFFRREVRPHAPDAWIGASKNAVGYEILFNRFFYEPMSLRPPEAIRADLDTLEEESQGLLSSITRGAST